MLLADVTPVLGPRVTYSIAFVVGALWGSFLNVVIYRVPRSLSVVYPASHCPHCGAAIAAYDNMPLVSFALLRGKTRCCKKSISVRYPVVELLGAVLAVAIVHTTLGSLGHSVTLLRAIAVIVAKFALGMGLLAAAFIDAEHMFLPDSITLGGTLLGIATATLRDMSFEQSVVGSAVGFFGIWFPFTFLYKKLLGRTGMGMGDAKLLALAGSWFGLQGAVFVLFAGALQGCIYAATLRLLQIKPELPAAVKEDLAQLRQLAAEGDADAQEALDADPLAEDAGARIAFGPFLILSCFELMLAADPIDAYLRPFLRLDF